LWERAGSKREEAAAADDRESAIPWPRPHLTEALDDMHLPVALVLIGTASGIAAPCLTYSGEVKLEGTLSRHTFAEQPNYESIERGDAKATYFFVSLREPVCVAEGKNDDGLEPAEPRVDRVQLVFTDSATESYSSLGPLLGKTVWCRGSLYHSISGHHHSPVLLEDAKCERAQQGLPADAQKGAARR